MVRMLAPNGAEVQAYEGHVERLLAMGFRRAGDDKRAPRKRAPRKTKEH